nr:hypothetical protein [Asaia astilbis]
MLKHVEATHEEIEDALAHGSIQAVITKGRFIGKATQPHEKTVTEGKASAHLVNREACLLGRLNQREARPAFIGGKRKSCLQKRQIKLFAIDTRHKPVPVFLRPIIPYGRLVTIE